MSFLINPFIFTPPSPYTALPSDFAGLVRWWDATTYLGQGYVNNDPLTTNWIDNSASLDDAVPFVTSPPQYNDTQLSGGKPSVFINSLAANNRRFDFTLLTMGDFTILALWKPTSDSYLLTRATDNYQVRLTGANPSPYQANLFLNGGSNLDCSGAFPGLGTWRMSSWKRTGATGVALFQYNKNEMPEKDSQTNTNSINLNRLSGYIFNASGIFYLAELCIYNTVLTKANIDALYDGYFAIKFAGDL